MHLLRILVFACSWQSFLSEDQYSSFYIRTDFCGGAWVAQLVKHSTSAQVMISQFVSSSPAFCADSSQPGACFGVCASLSLSAPLLLILCISKINKHKKKKNRLLWMILIASWKTAFFLFPPPLLAHVIPWYVHTRIAETAVPSEIVLKIT